MSNVVPKRTRMSPEDRYEQLVNASVELLLTQPIIDLTVEAVAGAVGVSRALIFHYFPTVHELRLAALRVAADSLVASITDAVNRAPEDDASRLSAGISAFVSFIELQPGTFDALSAMAESDKEFGTVFQRVREQAATLVHEGLNIDLTPLNRSLIGGWVTFVETVVRDWVRDPHEIDRGDLLTSLIEGASALIGPGRDRPY